MLRLEVVEFLAEDDRRLVAVTVQQQHVLAGLGQVFGHRANGRDADARRDQQDLRALRSLGGENAVRTVNQNACAGLQLADGGGVVADAFDAEPKVLAVRWAREREGVALPAEPRRQKADQNELSASGGQRCQVPGGLLDYRAVGWSPGIDDRAEDPDPDEPEGLPGKGRGCTQADGALASGAAPVAEALQRGRDRRKQPSIHLREPTTEQTH